MKILVEGLHGEDELRNFAAVVAERLNSSGQPYVLALVGGMGAGKTTFVRHLLYHFGLSPLIPVNSPTFSLMQEYEIRGEWFAHLDLYRAEAGFSLDQIGLFDQRVYRGTFIEWPEKHIDPWMEFSHRLTITSPAQLEDSPAARDNRSYRLEVL